ncbi:MAG: hypothetical protein L6R41_006522 [Letrouitia leprolyta]|nr:MAG: hypothetical protein L6R41_006522 [Letrouitia leprolyta]
MTNSTSTDNTPDNPYLYDPSFPLALVFAFLFSIAGLYHLYLYFRNRAWFLYFILLGIAMEALGFWARAYNVKNLKNFNSYSISFLLIMLAPSFLAAGLYQTFGRLLYFTVPASHRTFRSLFLPARFIAPFFVIFDVVSFFIQLIGLTIVVEKIKKDKNDVKGQKTGINILRFGLILQTLVFGVFALLAMRIVLISKRWQFAWPDGGEWKRLGWAVSIGSYLITFRAVYRIFEYTIKDGDNYLANHEWPAYAFDGLPMVILLVIFALYHPGKYLPGTHISFNHAYKRIGNPGNRSSDLRPKGGVELNTAPYVTVLSAENGQWTAPQHNRQVSTSSQDEWGSTLPQVADPHNPEENVYRPYRPRSPSPNPQEGLLHSRA